MITFKVSLRSFALPSLIRPAYSSVGISSLEGKDKAEEEEEDEAITWTQFGVEYTHENDADEEDVQGWEDLRSSVEEHNADLEEERKWDLDSIQSPPGSPPWTDLYKVDFVWGLPESPSRLSSKFGGDDSDDMMAEGSELGGATVVKPEERIISKPLQGEQFNAFRTEKRKRCDTSDSESKELEVLAEKLE